MKIGLRLLCFAAAAGLTGCAAGGKELRASNRRLSDAERIARSQSPDFLSDIPKISTHEHYRAGGDLDTYVNVISQFGIEKVILVPTGGSPDNHGYAQHMEELLRVAKHYPDCVIPYATVDEADPNAPAILEEAVRRGARGLKLMGGHPKFYDEPLDSPKMMTLFEKVRELHIPVLIHVSLIRVPKQLPEFENLVKAFPDITIVAAHYARTAPDFTEGARLLDTYPNLVMDVSMGGGLPRYQKEIPIALEQYRNFVLTYQDRLLWGTDVILSQKMAEQYLMERIPLDFLVLGKSDYVDQREGKDPHVIHTGLNLPRPVLRKIFYENPKRILGL